MDIKESKELPDTVFKVVNKLTQMFNCFKYYPPKDYQNELFLPEVRYAHIEIEPNHLSLDESVEIVNTLKPTKKEFRVQDVHERSTILEMPRLLVVTRESGSGFSPQGYEYPEYSFIIYWIYEDLLISLPICINGVNCTLIDKVKEYISITKKLIPKGFSPYCYKFFEDGATMYDVKESFGEVIDIVDGKLILEKDIVDDILSKIGLTC